MSDTRLIVLAADRDLMTGRVLGRHESLAKAEDQFENVRCEEDVVILYSQRQGRIIGVRSDGTPAWVRVWKDSPR